MKMHDYIIWLRVSDVDYLVASIAISDVFIRAILVLNLCQGGYTH